MNSSCFNSCQEGMLLFLFLLDVLVNKNLWARWIVIHFKTFFVKCYDPTLQALCSDLSVCSFFCPSDLLFGAYFLSFWQSLVQTSPKKVPEGKECNDLQPGSREQLKKFSVNSFFGHIFILFHWEDRLDLNP